MKKSLIILLCSVLSYSVLCGCEQTNNANTENEKSETADKNIEDDNMSGPVAPMSSDDTETDEKKVERNTPPVLFKETYYYADGSNKKKCTEQTTTIYKYDQSGLFIRSNQYNPAGMNPESLDKILNDDWSQKNVEYDESGNLIAEIRDDGRYSSIFSYDNDGKLIKEYYNLDDDATLTDFTADTVTNYYYDDKGNLIKEDHCRVQEDGTESSYSYAEYEYDAAGNMISRTADSGLSAYPSKTTYTYDENNRMMSEISEKDGKILEMYDGYGHRTFYNDENYYCAHEFDEDGRLVKCTYTAPADGHFTYITDEYNEWGQVIKSTKFDFYKWEVNSIADLKTPGGCEVRTYIYGYPDEFDLSKLVSEDNFKIEASDMIIDEAEYNRQLETLDE